MKNQSTSPALIRAMIHSKIAGSCVDRQDVFDRGQHGQGDKNDHTSVQFI